MALNEFEAILRKTIATVVVNGKSDHPTLNPIFTRLKTAFTNLGDVTAANRIIMANRIGMEELIEKLEDRTIPAYRSYMDTTIRYILNFSSRETISWEKWIQNYIAFRFLHFLQGITMFQSRDTQINIGRPAYHRITSCGEWVRDQDKNISENFEQQNLKCNPDLAPDELERTRRNIWTCLIERLIYNEIYIRYFGKKQDSRHMYNEIRVTRNLFESCFSSMNFVVDDVQVLFDNNDIPVTLKIKYETNNYTVVETYTKEITHDVYAVPVLVHCKKDVAPTSSVSSGPGDEYRKIQSYFSEPADWLPLSPGAPPVSGGRAKKKNVHADWKPNCLIIDPWK